MKQQLGQLFVIGIQNTQLLPEEARFITENNIGGVILFSRNIESPEQTFNLCKEIQNLKKQTSEKAPFFISIDMEGGRVHRLPRPFTQWPSFQQLANTHSPSMAFNFSKAMGLELRAAGINLNFSPCLDVLTNSQNSLIGDRSFGSDPNEVAKMGRSIFRGFTKSQIIACAKHFPGHGNTLVDSHKALPVDDTDLETLKKRELIPFQKLFQSKLSMLMTAHVKYEQIDPNAPATLSHKILTQILRDQLNYRGITISDDLDMKALAHYDKKDIPVKALNAGCDILLYSNEASSPPLAIENCQKALEDGRLSSEKIKASYQKVIALKKSLPTESTLNSKWIGHLEHIRLAEEIRNSI